jgi:hypothetical protein
MINDGFSLQLLNGKKQTMKMKHILLVILILFQSAQIGFSQDILRKQYLAVRITNSPVINGVLDDEAWQSGEWAGGFTQNQPYSGRPESQKTEFKILFDDNNLYVAIKAFDTSPDSIVNHLSRRDQQDGDLVGIIIDSYHDLRTGFLFGVSSTGVKYDHMMTNDGQDEDASWDPDWWVKTTINSEGWVAEMKIPFSQVRFEKNSGDVWGFDVGRVLYRKNETTYWQHIPKDASGLMHLFAELKGLGQIRPRKIFDVTPYGVARTENFTKDPGNPFMATGKKSAVSGGVDAKIGITNNLTMDLTVNPDFGQVEADPSEVNLTAYETFFPEKRPFFVEGSNITSFGLGIGDGEVGNDNLFYSRRIGRRPQIYPGLKDGWNSDIPVQTNIISAAKITGKTSNGLSVGFIEALTNQMKATIDTVSGRTTQTVEPLTNYMIGRLQKDINNGNTLIGGMLTSTNRYLDASTADFLNKAAYSGGADFIQYFHDKNWMLNINAAFSLVEGSRKAIGITQLSPAHYFQRPDDHYASLDTNRTSLAGSGGRIQVLKLNGHWNFMSATSWKTPGFEINDLGYMREADQVITLLWAQYNQYEPEGIYRRFNINSDVYSIWNFGGTICSKGYEWNANMDLKNFWSIYSGGAVRGTSNDQTVLRGGPMMMVPGSIQGRIGFSSDNRKKVILHGNISDNIGFGKSSFNFSSDLEISYKPTNWLVVSFDPVYSKSYNQLQYVTGVSVDDHEKYIFASIDRKTLSTSLRVNVNLSPDLTIQYWGQPFFATGKYYDYKLIIDPQAHHYNDRFHSYTDKQITLNGDTYLVDEGAGGTSEYSFNRSDFNIREFLSNLVIRWEFSPGSSVYLVWSQTRSGSSDPGTLNLFNDFTGLFRSAESNPHNIFLVKFSYRFGLK